MQAAVEAILSVVAVYAACGLLFAALFLTLGITRVDGQAKGSGLAFRLIVFPGVAALWPLLLALWVHGAPEPPVERNAHRARAGSRKS